MSRARVAAQHDWEEKEEGRRHHSRSYARTLIRGKVKKLPFYINLKLQSTMNTKKLSTFKLIIKVIAAIATAVLGVIAGKGLGDED